MRRGLKSQDVDADDAPDHNRSEDSPMRRGLKSSCFAPVRRARYAIRRFPDEEGTEIRVLHDCLLSRLARDQKIPR